MLGLSIIKISKVILGFGLLVLISHHLKLYNNLYLGIPFDHWIHFTAGIFFGLVFYGYLSKIIEDRLEFVILSVLVALGFGTTLEIVEFIGYSYMGKERDYCSMGQETGVNGTIYTGI